MSSAGLNSPGSPQPTQSSDVDKFAKTSVAKDAKIFPSRLELPRPPPISSGQPVQILTNHFDASTGTIAEIRKYTASFTPNYTVKRRGANGQERDVQPEITKSRRHQILTLLLSQGPFHAAATDYYDLIVSATAIDQQSFVVDLPDNRQNVQTQQIIQRTWTVTLDLISTLSCDSLRIYQEQGNFDNCAEVINALNLMVSRVPAQSNTISRHGRTADRFFSFTANKQNLGGGLEAAFGFRRSVRPLQGGLMLQLSNSAAAFYREIRVDRLINEFIGVGPNNNSFAQKLLNGHATLQRFLRTVKVQKSYGGREIHSIWEIPKNKRSGQLLRPNDISFEADIEGKKMKVTLPDYLRRKYNIFRTESNIVIDVGSDGRPVYVPADKLQVLPGNLYRKLLDSNQTASMVEAAARTPGTNLLDIESNGTAMFALGSTGPLVCLSCRVSLTVLTQRWR
jgi:eukaryotic translation initiation factor 2C